MAAASGIGFGGVQFRSLEVTAADTTISKLDTLTPPIISKDEFHKLFADAIDVEMDCATIVAPGQKALCTTGIAADTAVCAIGYSNEGPIKYGLFRHSFHNESFTRFLNAMQKNISHVHVYVLGGFGDPSAMQAVLRESNVKVVYELYNPLKVDINKYVEDEHYYEEEYHFALSFGLTADGKIFIADETNGSQAGSFVTNHPAKLPDFVAGGIKV